MRKPLVRLGALAGVWEFVVGDDWQTALGIVLALGLTALVAAADVTAWWVMPLAALALLRSSVRRRSRLSAALRDGAGVERKRAPSSEL
jgi:hypothetical protein